MQWTDASGTIIKDLKFGDRDETGYDLYIPSGLDKEQNQSLILFIHGGGFTGGDKADEDIWCKFFASKGYITASVNYTLKDGRHDSNINLMDEEILACVEAVKEECSSQGYCLTEMALSGQSAGGCLSMLYAYKYADTSPIPVKFVFQQTGPANFAPELWGNADGASKAAFVAMMTGQGVTEKMIEDGSYRKLVDDISPSAFVNAETVPTLCAYGPKDKVVPVEIKYRLFEQFDQYGVTYEFIEYPNSGHGLLKDPDKQQEFIDKALEYCNLYFENK
ncbi:MAG: alpha/beta hydrolase [Butyrivibrio sp.]|nr:alpha/beta hydrolase [Butyrivibrio sp.]